MVSYDEQIRGDIIRKDFDELDALGPMLKDGMISYIERRGNPLDAGHTYTLKEIKIELGDVFGEDAAALLVEKLRRGVDAAKSFVIMAAPVAGLLLASIANNSSRLLA